MFYVSLFINLPNPPLSLKKLNRSLLSFIWKFIFNKPTLSVFKCLTKLSYIKLSYFKKSKNLPSSLQTSLIIYDKTSTKYSQSKYSLLTSSFISLFPSKNFKSNNLSELLVFNNSFNIISLQASTIKYLFQLDWYYFFRYLMYFFNLFEISCNIYLLKFFSILSSKTITQFNFQFKQKHKISFYRNKLLYI
jgi:hypothetical protein